MRYAAPVDRWCCCGLVGYSLGGCIDLQTAIRHPQVVHKLVVVSPPFKGDGWYPEMLGNGTVGAQTAESLKQTPMYQCYSALAPGHRIGQSGTPSSPT